MDSIVTARVPTEIKAQATRMLAEMGSSTTKLVNAAFEYLLATGELPRPVQGGQAAPSPRILDDDQRAELSAFFRATSSPAPDSFWAELGERSYKDAIAAWRTEDHEALA